MYTLWSQIYGGLENFPNINRRWGGVGGGGGIGKWMCLFLFASYLKRETKDRMSKFSVSTI